MTTWADLLLDVRNDLQDTGLTPRWTDEMLYLYTKDAVRDYSLWFPKRVDRASITPLNGAYLLFADFVSEIYVELPQDTFLERQQVRPGSRHPKAPVVRSYYLQGGSIYLNTASEDPLLLTYMATHPVPAVASDATFLFTIPDTDLELLRLYIKAKVYQQMRSKQAALDRFKLGSGKRDDNPLQPETDDLMREYQRGIAERTRGGVIILYRLGGLR